MALFVIVETGSLSAAGRALGLPKATISRRLVQLEGLMGTPLLAHSTRALTMTTDAGKRFFERVQPIVHEAEAAQSEIMSANTEPSGTAIDGTDHRWRGRRGIRAGAVPPTVS
jgi:DNA-binding transcriptional LysR family regulator